MIATWVKAYYAPGSLNDLHNIYPQCICISDRYKGTLIDHFHDGNDCYAELNLKRYNPYWQNAEPVERVYIKYHKKTTVQTTKLLYLTKQIRRPRNYKSLFVSPIRITITSILHRKTYSDKNQAGAYQVPIFALVILHRALEGAMTYQCSAQI